MFTSHYIQILFKPNLVSFSWPDGITITGMDGFELEHGGSALLSIDNDLLIEVEKVPSGNYYKCLRNSKPGGLYLKKVDVQNQGIVYHSYADLIFIYGHGLKHEDRPKIGVNVPNTCLNIRSGPSVKSPIIGCVHSNELNPVGESRIEFLPEL